MRDLRADEIDLRIQRVVVKNNRPDGVILLCYKDARVDMDILDETYGSMGWQRTHEFKDGKLYCTVSVWDDTKKQWISKEDVGTESNTEAEKGQASDSFKRANFNWGIGRELYTAPLIWVNEFDCNIYDTKRKDKYGVPVFACTDSFSVKSITIENKVITAISVRNNKTGKIVFTYDKNKPQKPKPEPPSVQPLPAPPPPEPPAASPPVEPHAAPPDAEIHCDKCKKIIKPTLNRNNKLMSAQEIAEFSEKRFGKCLCPACQKIENERAKA